MGCDYAARIRREMARIPLSPPQAQALCALLEAALDQPGGADRLQAARRARFGDPPLRFDRAALPDEGDPSGRARAILSGLALPEGLAPLASLLPHLAQLPRLVDFYAQQGIDDQVLGDTLKDIPIWMEDHRAKHGVYGMAEADWLANHFSGGLFRLSRLQFAFHRFEEGIARLYTDGTRFAALAEAGLTVRRDGFLQGVCGLTDAHAFTTSLEQTAQGPAGYAVEPATGRVLQPAVSLGRDFQPALAAGEAVIDIHIPADGPMDIAACREAFVRALDFFPRHFPSWPWRFFTCESWLMAPQLPLVGRGNTAIFQRQFLILPYDGGDEQMFERLYGCDPVRDPAGLDALPQGSSLQRAMRAHLLSGGVFTAMHGVIPRQLAGDFGRIQYATR